MSTVTSIDPATGQVIEAVATEHTADGVDAVIKAATAAGPALEDLGRGGRARLLRSLADELESHREEIVPLAERETALGTQRLTGELSRTAYQLRLFAEVLDEGSYLEAAIDHPGTTAMGPRPDLRRMLVPLGAVAVFGASNFPLAFSVPGGDTASALAAGCPVVVKAHASHPRTSQRCFEVMAEAVRSAGAPDGTIGLVHGFDAGASLVAHPDIRAVGFTGSLRGGQALMSIIRRRPDPIPFYGELSSVNPVVVTPRAARERAEEIGEGLVGSVTLGGGQFCTKPGIAFVPTGPDGDRLVEAMVRALADTTAPYLLNEGIAESYREAVSRLGSSSGLTILSRGGLDEGPGFGAQPMLFATDTAAFASEVAEEVFGPMSVVVRYDEQCDLLRALDRLPGSLTGTLQTGGDDQQLVRAVSERFRERTGRLVFNGYPTGVAVSWAQHHGGPWPSTNSIHTSVGTSAIRRFLRPVTWQSAPPEVLPAELQDDYTAIPRRIDGVLKLASTEPTG